ILKDQKLDGLLVMSSYNRRYLSEVTGSSGAVIITQEESLLMSDFRYKAQGKEQAKNLKFILQESSLIDSIINFLQEKGVKTLGFEGERVNYNTYDKLNSSFELVALTGEVEKIQKFKTNDELDIIQKACK